MTTMNDRPTNKRITNIIGVIFLATLVELFFAWLIVSLFVAYTGGW